MHEAYYFSVGTLPTEAKAVAIQRLRDAQVTAKHREEFDRVIDFMMNGASTDGKILRIKVADLDFKRSQNLRDVSPELARVIDYET